MIAIESISHLIEGRSFDNILGAHEMVLDEVVRGLAKKVFVLVHNTPHSRILCEDWGHEMLVLHNSYMTSFLDNLALVALATAHPQHRLGLKSAQELNCALAKKFFAEQMLAIRDSAMGRVLFLEAVIEHDQHLRSVFELRARDPKLAASSRLFTAMASDFLLHHELGHVVPVDDQFDTYVQRARDEAEAIPEYATWSSDRRARVREEIAADLFGLNIALGRYQKNASGTTLRQYLGFLAIVVTQLHVLYDLAAEAHRINVDPATDTGDIAERFSEWSHRQEIMFRYIEEMEFSEDTITPLDADDLLPLPLVRADIDVVTNEDMLVSKFSENSRRLAELVSAGFAEGSGFQQIVEGTRTTWVLDRP